MSAPSKGRRPVAEAEQVVRRVPKPRNQHDPLEIWQAYQEVRNQRHEVKALAKRFNLCRRRIQQIGNAERPVSKTPFSAHRPTNREESQITLDQASQERASFLAILDTGLAELQVMARRLNRDLEANQPRQPDLLGHTPALEPLQGQIADLRRMITKKIRIEKTNR